jgi:hypothetical protein
MTSDTLISTIINGSMVLLTFAALLQTRSIQRKDSKPVIAMNLFAKKNAVMFKIENVGKSGIKDCELRVVESKENITFQNSCFNNRITLYPTESMEDELKQLSLNDSYPNYVVVEVNYTEVLTNKRVKYIRQINFSGNKTEDYEVIQQMKDVVKYLSQIDKSENRMANYFEGRFIPSFDTCNPEPNGSFYEDLYCAYNREQNSRPKTKEEWKEHIKKIEKMREETSDKRNYFRDENGELYIPK